MTHREPDEHTPPDGPCRLILHASTVALGARAVLILGASGAGKSSLALDLMSRGAVLVADDRTALAARAGELVASCPSARIAGRIEARGVGILAAEALASAPVRLIVDLDREEPERLPPRRRREILGVSLPLLHGRSLPNLAPAIVQTLKGGRIA